MKKFTVLLVILAFTLVSCSQQGEPTTPVATPPVQPSPTSQIPPDTTPGSPPPAGTAADRLLVDQAIPWPGLHQDRTDLVAASGTCSACHSGLADAAGNDVSFDSLWRSSMHAFAAVDPYWQASVSAEVVENPELAAMIEDKCATCHMPLARFDATAYGETTGVIGAGFANPENPLHDLAMDAVSCTSCHQIMPDNLDSPESFSGGYLIDGETTEYGQRIIYGPFPIGQQPASVMASGSGFTAVQSAHITESAMCATCHTLYTPYLDTNGEVAGEFPEQMVYFEWENSVYAQTESCQSCHMPLVDENIRISTVMGQPKPYLRLHTFVGSNAFIRDLIGTNSELLDARANQMETDAAVLAAVGMLQTQTADLQAVGAVQPDGYISVDVTISSLTGHKFPSAFPSRRAWLHITVMDKDGDPVFESGAVSPNGFIEGNDNDLDPERYEPHYTEITGPDQVQIYETILETTEGEVTTTLLYGAGYAKDNRLLPAGFDPGLAIPETASFGLAADDPDFTAGGDSIRYLVRVIGFQAPYTVSVELKYQSIGYRWAENLRRFGTTETDSFMTFYDGAVNLPVTVDKVEIEVGQ
jgi:hypothetical protein